MVEPRRRLARPCYISEPDRLPKPGREHKKAPRGGALGERYVFDWPQDRSGPKLCLGPRVRICPQTFGGHSHRREAQIKSAGKKEARRLVATGLGELLPVSRRRGLRGR